ncbi:MAG: ceramidase domain-containing protein [Panacagrimonas sp.]
MNWQAPLDLYCERFGPGLFAEPLNALSNLAFVAAGLWLLGTLPRVFARPQRVPPALEVLAGLIVIIGICSGAFHVVATQWAQALDLGSIALFIYFFVVCFAHYILDVRWALAWIAAPAFWAFGLFVRAPFDANAFNGSVIYFPALAGIALMGAGLAAQRRPGAGLFGLATLIFIVSITLRSVDLAWCNGWVWGTHWAWHLLNGGVLAIVTLGLARAIPRSA